MITQTKLYLALSLLLLGAFFLAGCAGSQAELEPTPFIEKAEGEELRVKKEILSSAYLTRHLFTARKWDMNWS